MDHQGAEVEKALGNEKFKQGKYTEAIEHYSRSIKIAPGNNVYYLNRAMSLLKLEKYDQAEKDCSTVLKTDGNNVKALYRRAMALEGLKYFEEAQIDLERALRIEPGNKNIKSELEKVQGIIAELEREKVQIPIETLDINKTPKDILEFRNKVVKNEKPDSLSKVLSIKRVYDPEPPKSLLEFERCWKEAKNDPNNIIVLLKKIPQGSLPKLFGASFEEGHLVSIIDALSLCCKNSDPASKRDNVLFACKVLEEISITARFRLALTFLSTPNKQKLTKIIDEIESSGINKDITKLKSQYLV